MKTMITRITNFQGTHFEMYRNIKSLCCVPETNTQQFVNYTSKTTKKRDPICGHQRWGVWGGGIR